MRNLQRIALGLGLLTGSTAALATCPVPVSPFFIRSCVDTITRAQLTGTGVNAGRVTVTVNANDDANVGCSGGLLLEPSNPNYDQFYQIIMIATAVFITVDFDLDSGSGATSCEIRSISLDP